MLIDPLSIYDSSKIGAGKVFQQGTKLPPVCFVENDL